MPRRGPLARSLLETAYRAVGCDAVPHIQGKAGRAGVGLYGAVRYRSGGGPGPRQSRRVADPRLGSGLGDRAADGLPGNGASAPPPPHTPPTPPPPPPSSRPCPP